MATKAKNREEQESIDPETGATIEMPDWDQLSPEENVIINNLLAKLHHNHRKAFELHRLGYKYSSSDPTQSMAVMLDKTPKLSRVGLSRHINKYLTYWDHQNDKYTKNT